MKQGRYEHVKEILRDYPEIDRYIYERRQELMYPHNEAPDENIGGGKSNVPGNPVEDLVVTLTADRRLIELEKNRDVVRDCYASADKDTRTIIEELYFKKHPSLTLEGVARKLNISAATAKRWRTEFFEEIAEKRW